MSGTDDNYIFKDLRSSTGGNHTSKLYIITVVSENDTEAVVEYKVVKRYKIQELEQAKRDYELLDGSGLVLTLDQLLDIKRFGQWPKPKAKGKS